MIRAWPLSVRPLADETTSSWLVRAARGYGETPTGFTRHVWGPMPVWNRDLDATLPPAALECLSERLGVSFEQSSATSLRPMIARLGGSGPLTLGLLRVGVYHRLRRRHGMQYCAECLAEDDDPYYRRHWRLAFFTNCARHRTRLRDSCPACDSPLISHRVPELLLDHCATCGASLVGVTNPKDDPAFPMQEAAWDRWMRRGRCPGLDGPSFPDWIAGVRILYHAFCRSGLRPGLREVVEEATRIELPRHVPPGTFELSRVRHRARIFPAAWWLTEDWPDRFVAVARRTGLRLTDILDPKRIRPPMWLQDGLRQLPYLPRSRYQARQRPRQSRLSVPDARNRIDMAALIRARLDAVAMDEAPW